MHIIAASSCFGEALKDEFFTYALQLQKNANAMADAFVKRDTISFLEVQTTT
jgi:glycine hydroxymethyltransferase